MTYPLDIPLCESFDDFAWDPQEVRDLIPTMPLCFDDGGIPAGEARQFLGLEAAYE